MGSKRVTLEQRHKIVALGVHTRIKKSSIARMVGVSTRAVFATLKRYQTRGTVEDAPRSGRPRVTSSLEDQRILRMARRYPFRGSKVIKREGRLPCSERTVRRRLADGGLPRRVARHKPLLNPHHIAARLQWCRDRLNWTLNEWKQVIWSNERTFRLGKYGRVWVSRPVGRAYHPKYTNPSEDRGPTVQIWACFSGKGYGPCQVFAGTMNSTRYLQVLEKNLLPYMRDNWRRHADCYFQQDGATCHTAHIVKDWLDRHNINLLPWPAKSADLSPVENLWSILAHRVEEKRPKTVAELTAAINQEWQSLDMNLCQTLIDSLPNRVHEVIAADGYYTKY